MTDIKKQSVESVKEVINGLVTRLRNKIKESKLLRRELLPAIGARLHGHSKTMVGKILMYFLAWGVLIYVIAVGALWWASTAIMQDNLKLQAVQWIDKLDEISAPLYVSQDSEQFESIRQQISDFSEIAYLRYYASKSDVVLGEYRSPLMEGLTIPEMSEEYVEHLDKLSNTEESFYLAEDAESSLIRVSAPLWVESMSLDGLLDLDLDSESAKQIKIIGYIDLGLNFKSYQDQLARNIIFGSLIIAVVLIFLMMLGHYMIKRALSPLSHLQVPLKRLANGENNVRVNVEGDEEIRAICNALNLTIAAVEDRDEKLNKLANHDSLTGLANRHSFLRALKDEKINVIANDSTSAMFFIDLDKFKYVNDVMGHAAGDRLLKIISELLMDKMRRSDLVARYGGDEFAIIARKVSHHEAEKIAKVLVEGAQRLNFVEQGQTFESTFSIGVTMIESNTCTIGDIQSQADAACFLAKKAGRNCYRISDASQLVKNQTTLDVSWSQKLKDALEENRFKLQYQPMVNVKDGRPDFYEVLIRLRDENNELIPPDAFLSIAERLGLSVEIDRWVIRHALTEMSAMRESRKNVRFSINLSAHALEDEGIPVYIQQQLAIHHLSASDLMFEIRERVAMRHVDHASECLNKLHQLGCKLTLDGFGSGFDSFNYIMVWPIDYLKINNSYTDKICQTSIDKVIVQSMVRIARTIGKKTIASHVSDEAVLRALLEVGVDYVQGFYIDSPVSQITNKTFDMPTKVGSR